MLIKVFLNNEKTKRDSKPNKREDVVSFIEIVCGINNIENLFHHGEESYEHIVTRPLQKCSNINIGKYGCLKVLSVEH